MPATGGISPSTVFTKVDLPEPFRPTTDQNSPREIASEISRNLSARWTRGEVHGKAYPENTEAYRAYLKGRFFWNKRTGDDLRRAIEHFEEAIRADPYYAPAHVGVADSYLVLGVYSTIPLKDAYQQAKTAAQRALEIDPSSAEAHAAMAMVTAGADWNLPGALALFSRALELKPSYPTAHQWYAEHLVCADRFDEALAEIAETTLANISEFEQGRRGAALSNHVAPAR